MTNQCSHLKPIPPEDLYIISDAPQIYNNQFVLLSGCSGSGKSTLLGELANRGHSIISEPGRQIVKEELSIGGDGVPWLNAIKFADLAVSRSLYFYNSTKSEGQFTFFDRGLIDVFGIYNPLPDHLRRAAKKFRYNQKVFMTPPWKEIYRNDSERAHSYEDAVKMYDTLIKTYQDFGYEVVIVPKMDVTKRADFIERELRQSK